jgi:hypothetical protein
MGQIEIAMAEPIKVESHAETRQTASSPRRFDDARAIVTAPLSAGVTGRDGGPSDCQGTGQRNSVAYGHHYVIISLCQLTLSIICRFMRRLSQALIARITNGSLSPGSRLPSEDCLVQEYAVSRTAI